MRKLEFLGVLSVDKIELVDAIFGILYI
jgi:hypothetical protein